MSTTHQNPFEAARLSLIERLSAVKACAAIGSYPTPSDFLEVVRHVREVAACFDDWLETVGFQVAENAVNKVDMRVFDDAFSAAIEGNATFEIEECAEALRDAREAA